MQVMSRRHALASGGGVNKSVPSVNTSNPSLPWVMTSATVSHIVPGIRGIHRGTRRKCRDSESEQSCLNHVCNTPFPSREIVQSARTLVAPSAQQMHKGCKDRHSFYVTAGVLALVVHTFETHAAGARRGRMLHERNDTSARGGRMGGRRAGGDTRCTRHGRDPLGPLSRTLTETDCIVAMP